MSDPAAMTASPFPEQALPDWRRAVLKVGSSLLAADGGGLSPRYALGLAQFVSANVLAGREMVIVSSGAVAAGRAILPRVEAAGAAMAARQALAALGQAQLIGLWQRFFERPVAQVLLTHDDLRNRRRYLNARATLNELLRLGALPVVNENDTVSVDELKLGDNDNLAATVAALVDADVLFIATDNDRLVPPDESQSLYAGAGEPKKLVMLKGFGHYEVYAGEALRQVMDTTLAWFGEHLPAKLAEGIVNCRGELPSLAGQGAARHRIHLFRTDSGIRDTSVPSDALILHP